MSAVESNNLLLEESAPARRPGRSERRAAPQKSLPPDFARRITTHDIATVTRQLATLLQAGMTLVHALSAIIEQLQETGPLNRPEKSPHRSESTSPPRRSRENLLAMVLQQVRDDVNQGLPFSEALARYPEIFHPVYVNMVAAGQTSGALDDVLLRLAEMLEKRVQLAGKVKAAVAYPLVMAVVAVAVVGFLLWYVVPSITEIFVQMNRRLPWPTTALISICSFIRTYWLLFPAIACIALLVAGTWVKTPKGRLRWDRFKLALPLFGALFLKFEVARIARTLGLLLRSGVPILQALEQVKATAGNRVVANALASVQERLAKGDDLARAMKTTALFPPIVVHATATGQVSGNIERALIDIADMYDSEVELAARQLTSLLEPAVLLVVGALIGFIVLAILLPIFEIQQVI